MVVAIATWTRNAAAAPSHTESGRPRVARSRRANIVLSGSSPRKMSGNTVMIRDRSNPVPPAGPGHDAPARPRRHGTDGRSRPPATAGPGAGRSSRQHGDHLTGGYSPTIGQSISGYRGPSREGVVGTGASRWGYVAQRFPRTCRSCGIAFVVGVTTVRRGGIDAVHATDL